MTSKARNRKEAKELGLARFFTGKPCSRGHVSERDTNSGTCRACGKLFMQEYEKRPEIIQRNRDKRLAKEYGLREGEYAERLALQGGGCAICGATRGNKTRAHSLQVDHNHETGKVRGLLCLNCNRGIGSFMDDVTLLRRAIAYLELDR